MSGSLRGGSTSDDRGTDLHADQLVEKVAGGGEPTVALTGLVGNASKDGAWRLYLSQQFDEYVEFDASVVVHSAPIDESVPLAGTVVWVRAGAGLQYTHVSSRQVQADFLQGGITAGHLSGAGAASLGTAERLATGYACTRNYVCSTNPHIPACQLRTEYCGSLGCSPTGALCPTGAFIQGC